MSIIAVPEHAVANEHVQSLDPGSSHIVKRIKTQGRATGVAWMLGIGRFNGIAGSFLVAELTRRQFAFKEIFTVVAVAGVIAASALLVKQTTSSDSETVDAKGVGFSAR